MYNLRRVLEDWWGSERIPLKRSSSPLRLPTGDMSRFQTPDELDITSMIVEWLLPKHSRRTLRSVADAWRAKIELEAESTWNRVDRGQSLEVISSGAAPSMWTTGCDELAQVQWEVWNAEQGLQSPPDIAVAWLESGQSEASRVVLPLGLLCGWPNYSENYYYISNLVLHPALRANGADHSTLWTNPVGQKVCEALVDAAIDVSHELGNHGWVAATPPPGDERGWNALKFYYHDELTYRRMGHFTS